MSVVSIFMNFLFVCELLLLEYDDVTESQTGEFSAEFCRILFFICERQNGVFVG